MRTRLRGRQVYLTADEVTAFYHIYHGGSLTDSQQKDAESLFMKIMGEHDTTRITEGIKRIEYLLKDGDAP